MLVYTFKLNGEDITESVSIGAVVREILSEPLDMGSLHLPFDINDIEYKLKGLLEIIIQEYDIDTETYTTTIKHDLLIIYDEVVLSDRISVYTHDLQVMEYTAKFDDYDVKSLAYTKRLKDAGKAPFEYVLNWAEDPAIPIITQKNLVIQQFIYMSYLNFNRTYYNDEYIHIEKMEKPIFARLTEGHGVGEYGIPEKANAFFRVKDKDGNIVRGEWVISDNGQSFKLPINGEYDFEYGFKRYPRYDGSGNVINNHIDDHYPLFEEGTTTPATYVAYRFKVKIIDREGLSVYDLLMRVSDMVSKFGGIESKHYYDSTRLFEIDDEIAEYLKSVEAPQTYVQNATLRQVLNLIFSYVNSISRLKHNNSGLDVLTMDEFDKITGTFELEEIASKNVKRSGSELTIKATSFLERVMPTTLDEPTVITPAKDFYKTVRAININMTESDFELKLEKPIYKPIKFTTLIKDVKVKYTMAATHYDYITDDLIIDLTKRLITKEEWSLKETASNFQEPFMAKPFSLNIGMNKWNTENLYWQIGDKSISMSNVFGYLFKDTLIRNVIYSAVAEHFALNMIPPRYFTHTINSVPTEVINIAYNVEYKELVHYATDFMSVIAQDMLFNLEYISLEDMVVDSERKDDDDNFNYYGSAKLSQNEKLINIMAQTRGASADLQRTGQRDMVIGRYHETLDSLLKVGMFNEEHRLTITERTLVLHNEFIEAVYGLSRDFNRKAMFRGLQQEYRWSEIPTSKQVFQRNEMYKDYIIIDKLDGDTYSQEITKINSQAHKIILETFINKDYNESKKITIGYIKTDGMLEKLEPPKEDWNYFVIAPITSFGVEGGLSFAFSFENNMVAGDGLIFHEFGGLGSGTLFNKAVKYTKDDGTIDKLWFGLKEKHVDINKYSLDALDEYPLYTTQGDIDNTLIDCGNVDFDWHDSDYLIIHKDSSQVLKITYQVSIIPNNPIDYVIGSMFYSNNLLVKARDDKKMFLYMYNDEKYKYGIFDTLKVKDGYYDSVLLDDTKVTVSENIVDNSYDFMIDIDTGIGSSELWAIGDEDGNLYIACNSNEIGFKSTRLHFRPSVIEIGKE